MESFPHNNHWNQTYAGIVERLSVLEHGARAVKIGWSPEGRMKQALNCLARHQNPTFLKAPAFPLPSG